MLSLRILAKRYAKLSTGADLSTGEKRCNGFNCHNSAMRIEDEGLLMTALNAYRFLNRCASLLDH